MKLLKASIVFTLGIVAGQTMSQSPLTGTEVIVGLVASLVVVATAIYTRKHVTPALLVLVALLGVFRGATATGYSTAASWSDIPRNEERVTLEGVLFSNPAPANGRTRIRLDVETRAENNATYSINVYTGRLHDLTNSSRRSDDFRYGDRYRVSGRFLIRSTASNPGDISGTISTPSVELTGTTGGFALRPFISGFRSNTSYYLVDSLGSRTGGLAAAMLVGDRTKLRPETIEEFRTSGLSHILAISGLHIAMVGGIVLALSVWAIGRRRQLYLAVPLLAVWGYATLAGLTPSVNRAAIMFTVYLAARLFGRQRSVLPPLALAAVIMLAIDPEIIRSISFQLSFAAVLGIALFSARIAARGSEWIEPSRRIPPITKRPLVGMVYGTAVSLAATLATAPLVAFHFGAVPIWGIPSTLMVVPFLPLFIGGSGIVATVGAFVDVPVSAVGIAAHGTGNYMSFVAELFSSLPVGPIIVEGWSKALIAGWYGLLFASLKSRSITTKLRNVWESASQFGKETVTNRDQNAGNSPSSGTAWRRRQGHAAGIIWIAVAASLIAAGVTRADSRELVVTFFETNRGDMILIETPSGARLLVDGGDDPDVAVQNLESVMPPLDRRIDVLLSTHPDADHLGGLERVVERFNIETIIDSGVKHDSAVYESWAALVSKNDLNPLAKTKILTAQPDLAITLDRDVRLTVLQTECVVANCTNFNDRGVVARLDYRDVSFLLTGDVTSGGETDLILTDKPVRSTVLKVGHHGSRTSTTVEFLDAVDPALAIVTTGVKNQFGHPHDDVMKRLYDRLPDGAVYVTRDAGTVMVSTDGKRLWVASER
ncbi:MAG: ComEC/Rec2 family competence protein [Chloroflexi bacterium]|nr:ComEC/Rec2 family competence protein [Chloroflexota bacterium]